MKNILNITLKGLMAVVFTGISSTSFVLAGTPPFFPTDITLSAKGEIVMTEKGMNRISLS